MRDLRDLMIFGEVCRSANLSEAARKLELSPATVSRSISKLEFDLGARLFNRSNKNISITREGQIYKEYVDGILQKLDEAAYVIGDNNANPSGVIRLLTPSHYCRFVILPAMSEFFEQYPEIDVQMVVSEFPIDLVANKIDVALQFGPPPDLSLISRFIFKAPTHLVASPSYLAKKGIPKEPSDLRDHDCIGLQLESGPVEWQFFYLATGDRAAYVHQLKGRIAFFDHFSPGIDAAIAGLGVSVCDSHAIRPLLDSGQLKIVLPHYRIVGTEKGATELILTYPHRQHLPRRVRLLIDFLVATLTHNNLSAFDPQAFAAA